MYKLVNKYGLIASFGTVTLLLLISIGIYNSQEFIIDPINGALKNTEVYGMLDGEVIKKEALDKFDATRYADNPNENADIIGNVAPLLNLGYGLLIIGIISIVAMFVITGLKKPKALKISLVSIGAFVLLYFISRGLASSDVPENYSVDTTSDLFNLAGSLLTMAYLLGGLAIASIIGGGVIAYLKK